MENRIQIFNNPEFGEIRTATSSDGESLFCALDIARALQYSNPAKAIIDHCKGVTILETPTNGGIQKVKFISEPDVYRLIFKSNAPKAEQFNTWLASEVLPSIRKHGAYMTQQTIERTLTDPDYLIRLATAMKEERIKRFEAEQRAEIAEAKVAHDAPKVAFCDAVTSSRGSILIGELAKQITQNGVEIGQNRLFRWMRHNGFLGQSGMNFNIPMQRYVQQGLFELKTTVHTEGTDLVRAVTPMVTTKGQAYFINGFLSGRFSPAPAGGR